MAELAADPVPDHRPAYGLADHEADLSLGTAIRADQQVRRQQRPARPLAMAQSFSELRAPPHPGSRRQHHRSPQGERCGAGVRH
jgi:hypothetical protein